MISNTKPLNVRTRFAPSPTGDLHIGGVRTALFAYLFARHHQGEFLLRIEDTDRQRSSQQSVDAIINGMRWLGLAQDGDIIYQSQRFDRYQQAIDQLLDAGAAYYCDCSKQRLDQLRQQQMADKQKPRYDGHCRHRHNVKTENSVVRFRTPQSGDVTFDDLVLGRITINNSELDDLILRRSDGTPTYNLTVVVDDSDMAITHVIRGMDHVNNTPRQIHLLAALNVKLPLFAHLPMIHGKDGKKLSKRRDAVNVIDYRHQGYLPQALLNYLARLGWSHGDQEIFSLAELIDLFDGRHLSKSAAVFDQDKLDWLNQYYMKNLPSDEVSADLIDQFQAIGITPTEMPKLEQVLQLQLDRAKTLKQLAESSRYFYQPPGEYDDKAVKKFFHSQTAPLLQQIYQRLSSLPSWQADQIHQVIVDVAEQYQLAMGKVAQPIRIAVTGGTVSASIDQTLTLLGKEVSLLRLQQTINFCQTLPC